MTKNSPTGLKPHSFKCDNEPNYLIEEGYLDLHVWATYKCPNKCPHCYLRSLQSTTEDMTLEKLTELLLSIREYKQDWKVLRITMYGAEPQSLSPEWYIKAMFMASLTFPRTKIEYGMYTSLQSMNEDWINFFKILNAECGLGMLAISYDGDMRGKDYNLKLIKNLREMSRHGLRAGVMSVVNKSMLRLGPKNYVDFLEATGQTRFSLKPFIPIEGQMDKWITYAANMAEFSDFAIAVHEEWEKRGLNKTILSSTVSHICNHNTASQNTGGFAVFVDGGMRTMYMGYRNKLEYLQQWGVIDGKDGFAKMVNNPVRKAFLADQRLMHGRSDCLTCEHAGHCVAEVFKDDYDKSGECIGAKKFVDWAYKRYGAYYDSGC